MAEEQSGASPSAAFRRAFRDELLAPSITPVEVFASCFSVDSDSPYMWREYGDRGGGVVLICDTRLINASAPIFAAPTIYDRATQSEALFALYECCDTIAASAVTQAEGTQLTSSALALIRSYFSRTKSRALLLNASAGTRISSTSLKNTCAWSSAGPNRRAIPIQADGAPSPIVRVRLGPRHIANGIDELQKKLSAIGFAHLPIVGSAVDARDVD